jgi:hypothetical protein
MKRFLHIADGIDVSGINAGLEAHPELWDAHTIRKTAPGTPHSRMSDIWVRYNDVRPFRDAGDYRGFNDAHIPVWYPAWDAIPALRPVVFGLMSAVQGEMLGGVLITRIPSGMGIDPHVDKSWHVDYYDKFYISLKAAPGARFHTEGEHIEPEVGDIWRFDNRLSHWVVNDSDQDRITLIVCIRTDIFQRHNDRVQ